MYLSHVSSPGAETCELFARVAGVFREGRDVADVSCGIEKGALLTVNDPSSGGIRFVKFVPFKPFASRTGKTDDAETDGETA